MSACKHYAENEMVVAAHERRWLFRCHLKVLMVENYV